MVTKKCEGDGMSVFKKVLVMSGIILASQVGGKDVQAPKNEFLAFGPSKHSKENVVQNDNERKTVQLSVFEAVKNYKIMKKEDLNLFWRILSDVTNDSMMVFIPRKGEIKENETTLKTLFDELGLNVEVSSNVVTVNGKEKGYVVIKRTKNREYTLYELDLLRHNILRVLKKVKDDEKLSKPLLRMLAEVNARIPVRTSNPYKKSPFESTVISGYYSNKSSFGFEIYSKVWRCIYGSLGYDNKEKQLPLKGYLVLSNFRLGGGVKAKFKVVRDVDGYAAPVWSGFTVTGGYQFRVTPIILAMIGQKTVYFVDNADVNVLDGTENVWLSVDAGWNKSFNRDERKEDISVGLHLIDLEVSHIGLGATVTVQGPEYGEMNITPSFDFQIAW